MVKVYRSQITVIAEPFLLRILIKLIDRNIISLAPIIALTIYLTNNFEQYKQSSSKDGLSLKILLSLNRSVFVF